MTINIKNIEDDIAHAIKMREHHLNESKRWKQEIYRLRTDLARAQRINESNG